MMRYMFGVLCAMTLSACAEVGVDLEGAEPTSRVVPKSYSPPTVDTIAKEAGWRFEGTIQPGGQTQMGATTEFVAYDSFLEAGAQMKLYGWSSGWASLHVFGTKAGMDDWQEVTQTIMSNQVNTEVEAGQNRFSVPFDGHYLFLIGPVGGDALEYLLRLECQSDCGSMVQSSLPE